MEWRSVPRPMFLLPRVRELIESLSWSANGTKHRAAEIALGVFDAQEPNLYVARVERLELEIDWAFFMLGFNALESWLVEKAYGSAAERKNAAEALSQLAVESNRFAPHLDNYEDMADRLADLQALRNEVTHRSGVWSPRPEHEGALARLEAANEIVRASDPEGHSDSLIKVTSREGLLGDLTQIIVVCSTAPGGWQKRAEEIASADSTSPS